jgi:hypothetical protein
VDYPGVDEDVSSDKVVDYPGVDEDVSSDTVVDYPGVVHAAHHMWR